MKTVLYVTLLASATVLFACAPEEDITGDENGTEVASAEQALTWEFETIETNYSGSGQTSYYMYTLDSQYSNVCGWTGTPDYILHYNRSGAFANQDKLRMDGESLGAICFLTVNPSGLSSRVYDDNHVWVCAGKSRVDNCGGTSIFSGLRLWQAP